jgi:hypothetical protein
MLLPLVDMGNPGWSLPEAIVMAGAGSAAPGSGGHRHGHQICSHPGELDIAEYQAALR